MITRVSTVEELKRIYIEVLLNKTDKVTKVSDESILNGIAYGTAKVAQKALKDIALVESHLFPEYAYGYHLDDIAEREGIAPRYGASKSTTYIKLVADPGTTYQAATNLFQANGVVFELTDDFIVGSEGYGYAKVRSQSTGKSTNVPPLSITQVTPEPVGHQYVVNEYHATGGRDIESDELFRKRIKKGPNVLARGTMDYLTQVLLKFNSNILSVHNYGVNAQQQLVLAISTQNGIDLTQNELNQLAIDISPYLSLIDYNHISNNSINVVVKNIEYKLIDIDFRAELIQTANADQVRQEIQQQFAKYFDYRYWNPMQTVQWDDLLQIVKQHSAVKYVPDQFFNPRADIATYAGHLPRIRSFIIRDLQGDVMIDNSGIIDPIYYPNNIDVDYQSTII